MKIKLLIALISVLLMFSCSDNESNEGTTSDTSSDTIEDTTV